MLPKQQEPYTERNDQVGPQALIHKDADEFFEEIQNVYRAGIMAGSFWDFLSRALLDGQLSSYLASLEFTGVALLFYVGRQKKYVA